MSWVTALWSMVMTACLTLAFIHGLVWWKRRAALEHLLFAIMATATAVLAAMELWMMRATGPGEYARAVLWCHVPVCVLILALTGFVRRYLGTGSVKIAWAVCGLRVVSLILNFTTGENLNFKHVSGLRAVPFLGEMVSIGTGERNPVMLVGQLSLLLLMVFVVDATWGAWRKGLRREAVVVGGGAVLLSFCGGIHSALALWGVIEQPVMASVFYLGLVIAMAAELSRDVLRSAELSRELLESEERMSQAAAAAKLGMWVWDIRKDDIWGSDRFRVMFGFDAKESIGLNHFLGRVHPDHREGLKHKIQLSIEQGLPFESEYRIVNHAGEVRWIAASGSIEESIPDGTRRMRGICQDVTERRRSQDEAIRLKVELARVGRISMMGQLGSALAHELNQPLGAILRNVEAAEIFLKSDKPDLGEIREIIRDIRENDEQAGAVIDRMRSMLQRLPMETESVDIAGLMDGVNALVRGDASKREVEVVFQIDRGLPEVTADRIHLQQVLLNLILNGMDAVASAEPARRRVEVSATEDEEGVLIAIRDHGTGIDPQHLAEIFDPFYTTKPHGMGMGLAISATIVEAHGGMLDAANHESGGAIFRFQLSRTDQEK